MPRAERRAKAASWEERQCRVLRGEQMPRAENRYRQTLRLIFARGATARPPRSRKKTPGTFSAPQRCKASLQGSFHILGPCELCPPNTECLPHTEFLTSSPHAGEVLRRAQKVNDLLYNIGDRPPDVLSPL